MTNHHTMILSQELDDLREQLGTVSKKIEGLTDNLNKLDYRLGQLSRAIDRLAQYIGKT